MSNNFTTANEFLKSSLKGDGNNELQNSPVLNLPRRYYGFIYFAFAFAYIMNQLGTSNIFLQVISIVILANAPGQAILQLRVIDFSSQLLNYFFGLILSLIALMFVFATLVLLLPVVGITQTLNPVFVGIMTNLIVASSLYICAKKTNSQTKITIHWATVFRTKTNYFLISLPTLAFYATLRQNRYHESFPSIFLFVIVFIVLIALMSVKRIYDKDALVVALLYFSSLAIFIALIYRGETGFSGWDINSEFKVANDTLANNDWLASSPDAYNAMLSITILPVVLSIISKLSLLTIFKLFYISVGALIPSILFVFFRKYANPQAAIISIELFIIAGASYFGNLTALARQIIGLEIFIGILIVLFETKWSFARRQRFIFVLAVGLSFSHYSTAYIFAGMAMLSAIIYSILYLSNLTETLSESSRKSNLFKVHKSRVLTIPFALVLILIVYSWNGIITQSTQNLQSTVSSLIKQRNNLKVLPNKDQGLVLRYLAGNGAENMLTNEEIKRASVIVQTGSFPTLSIRPESYNYKIKSFMGRNSDNNSSMVVTKILTNLILNAKLISQAFVAFTLFMLMALFLRFRRKSIGDPVSDSPPSDENRVVALFESKFESLNLVPHLYDMTFLTLVSFLLAIASRSSGVIGQFYNTDRLALQMGMIWTLPLAIVLSILISNFKFGKLFSTLMIVCVTLNLIFQIGFFNVIRGDFTNKITSKNWQSQSNTISTEMFTTQKWITEKLEPKDFLQTDCSNYVSFGKFNIKGSLYRQSMPYNLDSSAIIYLGPNNLRQKIYVDCSGKIFQYPMDFLKNYYVPVYVSNNTEIYH